MSRYYKLDLRKLTLREFWNIQRSVMVLIPWLAARFGLIGDDATLAFRIPDSLRELEVSAADFPAPAAAGLNPLADECTKLGFHSPRYFTHSNLRGNIATSFITLLHGSGEYCVRLMHCIGTQVSPPKQTIIVSLISEFTNGIYLVTTNDEPRFRQAPGFDVNRMIGSRPDVLLESHQQRLAAVRWQTPVRAISTPEVLDEISDRFDRLGNEFQIARGIYKPMTEQEVADQQQITTATLPNGPSGATTAANDDYADVLSEIRLVQNKKGSWRGALVLLIVSVLVFMGAGTWRWSWDLVLIILPILFFHELGHYLAMRAFHYRNVRMFFIPLFGAAVSGRHYNVPGWKKVVVSLMGPVPGIVVGIILGAAGLLLEHETLTRISLMTLFLNGFNLLPILPLDGGWVFHTLVFSRHYLLDAGFRSLAALALLAGGLFGGGRLLLFLGVLMLIGIPAAFRLARLTDELRQRGLQPMANDDETLPSETARVIIDEVRKKMPKMHTTRMVAEQTLSIFESLNARPPGWGATIGFLFAYGASVGLALLFGLVFIFGKSGAETADGFRNFLPHPDRPVACGSIRRWDPGTSAESGKTITIIATFAGGAAQNFAHLTNQIPPTASLTLMGDSLMLSLPESDDAARRDWVGRFEEQAQDTFVEIDSFSVVCSLICTAPAGDIESIMDELENYFMTLPNAGLIPPWIQNDRRTEAELEAHALARRTYRKLADIPLGLHDEPRMDELQRTASAALRRGDRAEWDRLQQQLNNLYEQQRKDRFDRLRRLGAPSVDPVVIDVYERHLGESSSTNGNSQTAMRELAARMGSIESTEPDSPHAALRTSASSGAVTRSGNRVELAWIRFRHVAEGAPALMAWLCDRGCTDLKYELKSSWQYSEEN